VMSRSPPACPVLDLLPAANDNKSAVRCPPGITNERNGPKCGSIGPAHEEYVGA
jgi:hypothetical protein